ncbi:MAG TPA: peptidoglycan-binding domain-containing protein [Verrucomicrobiae bacterium]|jgi:peptidoglycan hydrolase-like protein with peptidoglycan-binding domain|nr:peptidoglycan-binding domain-containing protein [Verrucomicrobiae bacterium]
MKKVFQLSFVAVLLGLGAFSSGCASKSSTNRQINALQAQIGVLTDEVVRLDEQLQTSRGMAQESANGGGEGAVGGTYRTPSGFELPSLKIQQALKGAGYYQGTVDGKIGPGTRKAIKAFQKDNGLTADGVVGRTTWNKLKVYASDVK